MTADVQSLIVSVVAIESWQVSRLLVEIATTARRSSPLCAKKPMPTRSRMLCMVAVLQACLATLIPQPDLQVDRQNSHVCRMAM